MRNNFQNTVEVKFKKNLENIKINALLIFS